MHVVLARNKGPGVDTRGRHAFSLKWWVDGAYGVHYDLKGHTGVTMSMSKGSIISSSTRQKLNTRSSTKTELAAVDDAMLRILWTRYYFDAQGYRIENNTRYQDNTSAMSLENNGRTSSSQLTKHIHNHFFFITDQISNGEIQVVYCPTDEMLADFFTKPLQGKKFRAIRDRILNVPTPSKSTTVRADSIIGGIKQSSTYRSGGSQECVGN